MNRRQTFNAMYFGLLGAILLKGGTPLAIGAGVILVSLAGYALFLTTPSAQARGMAMSFELSAPIRRILRVTALIFPILALSGVIALGCQDNFARAVKFMDDGEYGKARECLNAVIAVAPYHQVALSKRAYANNWLFDYQSALNDATRAIELKKDDGGAHADRAWALNHLGRYEEAYTAATEGIKCDSENGEAFASLADASRALGKLEEALAADTRHCQLHCDEAEAFNSRAETYEMMMNEEAANADREHAAELESTES